MALTDKLTDIADAIRAKTGESDLLTLDEMPDAIEGITGGGVELPSSFFTITGNGDYLFANNRWQYLVENYSDDFNISVDSGNFMFLGVSYQIPQSLFISIGNANNSSVQIGNICSNMTNNISPPNINAVNITGINYFLANSTFSSIPNNYFSNITFKDNVNAINLGNMIGGLYYTNDIINLQTGKLSNFYTITGNNNFGWPIATTGSICGIINIPVFSTTNSTMRAATGYAQGAYISKITYSTDNGQPFQAKYINFTLEINCGWLSLSQTVFNNDTGRIKDFVYGSNLYLVCPSTYKDLTLAEKKELEVYDAASYQRLKNIPYYHTNYVGYSHYNKISALETIASLPDVSSYGSNTIKFVGNSGSLTDGGAINTMTAEEIAVATAKGWTVSFV